MFTCDLVVLGESMNRDFLKDVLEFQGVSHVRISHKGYICCF